MCDLQRPEQLLTFLLLQPVDACLHSWEVPHGHMITRAMTAERVELSGSNKAHLQPDDHASGIASPKAREVKLL